jgi:hypothetical protein
MFGMLTVVSDATSFALRGATEKLLAGAATAHVREEVMDRHDATIGLLDGIRRAMTTV